LNPFCQPCQLVDKSGQRFADSHIFGPRQYRNGSAAEDNATKRYWRKAFGGIHKKVEMV